MGIKLILENKKEDNLVKKIIYILMIICSIATICMQIFLHSGNMQDYAYRAMASIKFKNATKNFKEIGNPKDWNEAKQEGYNVYLQSKLAIKNIVKLKGENTVKNILLDSKNMDFYSAFNKNMGLNIDEFQNLIK